MLSLQINPNSVRLSWPALTVQIAAIIHSRIYILHKTGGATLIMIIKKPDKVNRRSEEAGARTRHILQYAAGGSKQHSSSSNSVRMIQKWRNEWELVRFSADVDVSPWLETITRPAVNTYNIKEALTGIYGVQQLVNVVLSRGGLD